MTGKAIYFLQQQEPEQAFSPSEQCWMLGLQKKFRGPVHEVRVYGHYASRRQS